MSMGSRWFMAVRRPATVWVLGRWGQSRKFGGITKRNFGLPSACPGLSRHSGQAAFVKSL